MSAPRRYLSNIDPGGRLTVVKSDGTSFTTDEKAMFDKVISSHLRNQSIAHTSGYRSDSDDLKLKQVHPLMEKLRKLIDDRNLQLRMLSEVIGRRPKALSEWLRGETKPYFGDIYALFGLLGYRLVPVPIQAEAEVLEIVAACEKEGQSELDIQSMG